MHPKVIEVQGVIRDFGRSRALAGLNLTVPAGEVYGLLGNNGAGKTTTLHILLGLLAPGAGSVRVFGLDPQSEREKVAAQIGFCPESDRPYDWLRIEEMCRFGAMTFADWDAAWATELCRRFALEPKKRFSELSKGMVAKAKLVFALAHRPRLLILDEPTSGLDPGSRFEILGILKNLAAERQTTTLLSSHHLDEVEKIATRIGILDRGILMLEMATAAIRQLPVLVFAQPPSPPPAGAWVFRRASGSGEEWLVPNLEDPLIAPVLAEAAARHNRVEVRMAGLPEVFLLVTGAMAAGTTGEAAA